MQDTNGQIAPEIEICLTPKYSSVQQHERRLRFQLERGGGAFQCDIFADRFSIQQIDVSLMFLFFFLSCLTDSD
jgi:hypothetical protein